MLMFFLGMIVGGVVGFFAMSWFAAGSFEDERTELMLKIMELRKKLEECERRR